jgi:Cys-tRNA(Pro) deacylase
MNSFKQDSDELQEFLKFFDEDLGNIRRVREYCIKNDLDVEFEIHPKAETVDESIQHSPVEKDQIVKTLVFKTGGDFVAVLCPGDERVDTDRIRELTGEENVRMANPEEVEEETGYVVGGVSPFDLDLPAYMEEELLEHGEVRPAAGSRVVGVEIEPEDLREAVDAEVTDIKV